ncbi:MAG: hypothetical protein QOE70_5493 [Chthoniobacter sp.]|nr:hypothetical protein [Chthoniobacter sp.]
MRGVMSLWTRTPMFVAQRGPMLIQTLAANLAARVFAETEFVTDKRGAEIAAVLGWPFGQVSTALEDWPAEGLAHIWALGKLVACALQERPFVQFDSDVLLFKPLPKRLTRHRLIAQSPDFPHYYTSREMQAAQALAGFAPGGAAYNAGLLGGSDVALVRAYAWAGLDLAQKFRGCALNGTSTSMIVEQYQLGVFSRRVGVEVGTLLPLAPTRKQVAKAGYAHLTGGAKREDKWIAKAEARLAVDFPEAYARFLAAWPRLAGSQGCGTAPSSDSSATVIAASF